MSEELKPCPACGSHNVSHSTETTRIRTYHFVFCEACLLLSGPVMDSKEEAIAAWNALPRALEWTKEPPKVPGWYWFRNVSKPTILHIKRVPMERRPHPADEWAGPFPEPREPK